MYLIDLFNTGFDTAYTEIPIGEAIFSLIGLAIIIVIYLFRKIPPFNVLWGFLVAVFVYAFINYICGKIRNWWDK